MPTTTGCGSDPFGQALWDHEHGRPALITIRRDDGLAGEQDAALYFAGPEALDPTEAQALAASRAGRMAGGADLEPGGGLLYCGVGIRKLKTRTSEIVRAVREGRVEYVVTYRGRPVARLVPVAEEEGREQAWRELGRLSREISAR